jgi:hypothetical protein
MASSIQAPSGSVITVASSSSSAAVCGTGSPCAACKFLRRKCQPDCVFAPYFPPDNPQKFVHVHRVFGASNVTKLLNDLHPFQREDAVNSLAYEADMRLRDPVYGCVGVISILQHNLRQLQQDLARAKYELSKYQVINGTIIHYSILRRHEHSTLVRHNCTGSCRVDFMLTAIGSLRFLVRQAAAANASTGPNGQQAMPEFLGNGMPNGGAHNFIDIGHSSGLVGSIGLFGQQDHFSNTQQMLSRGYDGEPIARLGMNGGYELGYSATVGGAAGAPVSGLGSLSVSSFLKSGTAGRDEKPSAGQ